MSRPLFVSSSVPRVWEADVSSIVTPRRPGILVLVNDTDWELEGELDYRLEDGDEIVFISTLHGG